MTAKTFQKLFIILVSVRSVNVHPVIVCNCNTNVTIHTSRNGSTVGISAVSSPQKPAQVSPSKPRNISEADGNIELKGEHRVLQQDDVDICVDAGCVMAAARILNSMDSRVDPCDDFFEYACGTWNRVNIIPDDKPSYTTFYQLRQQLAVIIKGLLEDPVTDSDMVAVKKTKNFYKSCVSDGAITDVGLAPLYDLLRELGGWPVLNGSDWNDTDFDLLTLIVQLRLYNNHILIDQRVSPDDKQSDRHIIQLDQADLGMPTREYYTDERVGCDVYQRYAIDVAVALGADRDVALRDMVAMVEFEIALANITLPEEQKRDSVLLYRKMTVGQLMQNVTGFNWLRYLQLIFKPLDIDITEKEEIVIYAMEYLSNLATLLQKTDNRVLANYMIWRIMMNRVNNLGKPYRDIKNEYSKTIYGTEMESARWRDCVSFINDNMGKVVGRLFVEKNFDVDSKHQALSMVKYIRESFYDLLDQAHWLDTPTRIVAREKVEAIGERIGFPDAILNDTALDEDFACIDFDPDRYFNNILSNIQNRARNHLRRLRIPVDKNEWATTPAVVNAFYSTSKNQIFFPAGILQPPFYSKGYPRSMNFGGIGMVIGHEITHGFDDRGRLFDKDGNMKQWWNDDVIERFKHEASCIVDYYANFTIPSINRKLNGVQTQGENIADNGGLKEAFRGYRKWIERENGGKEEPRLPGLEHLNNDQLLFLNFAQVWCGTMRPEAALNNVRSGTHCPGQFRVLGTLQNSREFAKTYKCPLNSPMNPAKKCLVW